MKNFLIVLLAFSLVLTTSCSSEVSNIPEIPSSSEVGFTRRMVTLEPYSDLTEMGIDDLSGYMMVHKNGFNYEDIYTYSFDMVFFEGADELRKNVIESGKNPGLGVRNLHEKGITGKGVNVAIIDQNLIIGHPEYADNIADYYPGNFPEEYYESGSMHGAAVTSFLAGKTCGVAPEAKVYFACGAMSFDAKPFAEALYWILEKNCVVAFV